MLVFGAGNLRALTLMLVGRPVSFDLSFAVASQAQWTELFDEIHPIAAPRVRSLAWSDNPISLKFLDAVVAFLADNSTLDAFTMIGTHKNRLTASDVLKIIRVLRANRTLKLLSVTKNEFDPAMLPEIAEILVANVTLRRLKFSPGQGDELQAFCDALTARKARPTVRTGANAPLAKRIVGKGPFPPKRADCESRGEVRAKQKRIPVG
jgi:hypothetical protein